ncbi:MAG: response regulator [Bacteroidota bacterium]
MKKRKILLVEDNEGDVLLTREAFEEINPHALLYVVTDGRSAVDYLENCIQEKSELPELILLDINLPRMDGHEVLSVIKNSKLMRNIPVIMLTTSSSENDVDKAYSNFANCYITKPHDVNDFFEVIGHIDDFWFKMARLNNT